MRVEPSKTVSYTVGIVNVCKVSVTGNSSLIFPTAVGLTSSRIVLLCGLVFSTHWMYIEWLTKVGHRERLSCLGYIDLRHFWRN